MGWTIESASNPAFHIGEQVLVSGIIGVWERWEKPLRGKIIGLALETAFDPTDIREDTLLLTSPWQYHIVLDDDTHLYSIESQLERGNTLQDKEKPMKQAQPRHPSTGRFVAKPPVKQGKAKTGTPQQQKVMPKSGKK